MRARLGCASEDRARVGEQQIRDDGRFPYVIIDINEDTSRRAARNTSAKADVPAFVIRRGRARSIGIVPTLLACVFRLWEQPDGIESRVEVVVGRLHRSPIFLP